jgi:hypothetical protein
LTEYIKYQYLYKLKDIYYAGYFFILVDWGIGDGGGGKKEDGTEVPSM